MRVFFLFCESNNKTRCIRRCYNVHFVTNFPLSLSNECKRGLWPNGTFGPLRDISLLCEMTQNYVIHQVISRQIFLNCRFVLLQYLLRIFNKQIVTNMSKISTSEPLAEGDSFLPNVQYVLSYAKLCVIYFIIPKT